MNFTPRRKLGYSVPSSPAPFSTIRTEKKPFDLRWAEGSSNSTSGDGDGEVNVQVVVRCRPLDEEELKTNVQNVVLCNERNREVTILQSTVNRQVDKTFLFDKVFGPKAQQRAIYDHAIYPIVNDVLEGFNCTVFAYGQTGTGKTYTMEGGMSSVKGGDLSSEAGVIPRAVRHIFETLDAQKADYSVKITFLELYNEEITDLLASEDSVRYAEEKQKRPISLMEDGKGGAVIRGLEEEVVYSASEIFSLLERGSAKRRNADTLLNTQSSRSHSIFSITIHIKEEVMRGKELVKCGRLNLVDLAGSENISRSGTREGRVAREAGEINKSLLTLGRVITALVEHSCHVPYRDSKLTRLLRESLGGKAKTCIIATISPSIHCLEETLSTLDYAYRAKSIRNKPEANQKVSKSVLLKDLYQEIERLRQDVRAAREKNGVYIPFERFAQDEAEKKAMMEKVEQLEVDLNFRKNEADSFQELYTIEQKHNLDLQNEINTYKTNTENLTKECFELQEKFKVNNLVLEEKEYIISRLLASENTIIERAKTLQSNLEIASDDILTLNAKIDQKTKIEAQNKGTVMNFGAQLDQSLRNLHQCVIVSVSQQHQILQSVEENTNSIIARKCEETKNMETKIKTIKNHYYSGVSIMKGMARELRDKASSNLEELKSTIAIQTTTIGNFLFTAISEAEQVLDYIQRSLVNQRQLLSLSVQQQEAGLQRTLESTQMISKTTVDFFNQVQSRASKLLASLDQNQVERNKQIGAFSKKFQEASAQQEKNALEKIACILSSVRKENIILVSEALEDLDFNSTKSKSKMMQDLSAMQELTSEAENGWMRYIEKVDSQFQEDNDSAIRTRDAMGNVVQECSGQVRQSMQQLKKVQLSIDQLTKDGNEELYACLQEENAANSNLLDELLSVSLSTDAKIDNGTDDLLETIHYALFLDHEAKRELESTKETSSDLLKLLQESHAMKTTNTIDLTEKYLLNEYVVDCQAGTTPNNQIINISSMKSIEALKTPSVDDLLRDMRSAADISSKESETKQQQFILSEAPRSPLTALN